MTADCESVPNHLIGLGTLDESLLKGFHHEKYKIQPVFCKWSRFCLPFYLNSAEGPQLQACSLRCSSRSQPLSFLDLHPWHRVPWALFWNRWVLLTVFWLDHTSEFFFGHLEEHSYYSLCLYMPLSLCILCVRVHVQRVALINACHVYSSAIHHCNYSFLQ